MDARDEKGGCQKRTMLMSRTNAVNAEEERRKKKEERRRKKMNETMDSESDVQLREYAGGHIFRSKIAIPKPNRINLLAFQM